MPQVKTIRTYYNITLQSKYGYMVIWTITKNYLVLFKNNKDPNEKLREFCEKNS